MRNYLLPALVLSAALLPQPLSAETLAPAAQRDLQCFMLFAIGVEQAVKSDNQKMQQGAGLGLTYYFGKLRIEAPNLVLADAIRTQATSMMGNPKTKEIGASCDEEFQKAGTELQSLGQELTSHPPETSAK